MNKIVAITTAAAIPVASPSIAAASPAPLGANAQDHSPAATLARAEEIVALLRTSYIREGWKLDEVAAERALDSLRRYKPAEGEEDDPDDVREAMDFFHSHGQSLDWIFFGDPKSMICMLAARSERANNFADPEILLLTEQYIAAEQNYCDLDRRVDEMKGKCTNKRPRPEVLRWRDTDEAELGLTVSGVWWDSYYDIDRLRMAKWSTTKIVDSDDEQSCSTRKFAPSDLARVRADEIISAFTEWNESSKLPRGFKKAVQEMKRAERHYLKLEKRIAKTRATTFLGMQAKIRCARAYEKSEIDLIEQGGCAEAMALSIFADIRRQAGSRA